jgi:hypothetical protein
VSRWIEDERRAVARLLQRCAQLVDRFHGLTIDRLDDIAALHPRVRGAAVGIHVLHDESLVARLDGDAERVRVVPIIRPVAVISRASQA